MAAIERAATGATITTHVTILSRAAGSPNLLRLADALETRGATVVVSRPAAFAAPPRDGPAVVVTRLPSGTPAAELAALAARWDGPWLNAPEALLTAHDKPVALRRLERAGLPVVPTRVLLRDEPPPETHTLPGPWLVVKPPTGLAGRGVVPRLPPAEALARARAYAELCGRAMLQPWLGEGLDRRVFLVGGRVAAGMARTPVDLGGRGNAAQGARVAAWDPDHDAVSLARAAADALGLDVAGVDLLYDEGRPLLLEVNACPGLSAIEAATGADVAGALAALALSRAQVV